MKSITENTDVILAVRAPRLEGNALAALQDDLRFLARPGRRLTLDLTAVEGVNASSAKILVDAQARLRQGGGALKLVGVRSRVAAYFELLRVHRVLEMQTTPALPVAMPMAA